MAQILKGETFANGQQVDGPRLNQLVDSATILVGAITEQTPMSSNSVEATDQTIISDGGVLKKVTVGDILNSNLPISTSSVTGGAGVDIVVTPAAGQKVDIAGSFEADSINSTGNASAIGNLTVGGTASITGQVNGTSALRIASGTTAQRPATPLAGHIRLNTESNTLEVYTGTGWVNGNTSGSALFDGTVNITGAVQYNGTPVYGMYDVVKYVTNPTPALTKGADEIWVVNIQGQWYPEGLGTVTPTLTITSTATLYGDNQEFVAGAGIFGSDWSTLYSYATMNANIVIPAGTTFSSKTITGNWQVIFITKYKTA